MRPVGVGSGSDGFLSVVEYGFRGSAIKIRVRQFNVTFEGLLIPKWVLPANLASLTIWGRCGVGLTQKASSVCQLF